MSINIKDLSKSVTISSFQHSLEPLWASDTGRNSNSGKYSGTFIGYFSQLDIEFGSTTDSEMIYIRSIFENSTISITYPDSSTGNEYTENFYGTAIPAKKDNWSGKYKSFSLTLTATEKRK